MLALCPVMRACAPAVLAFFAVTFVVAALAIDALVIRFGLVIVLLGVFVGMGVRLVWTALFPC